MNITTFTIEGPALVADASLPHPVETPMSPYPWDRFIEDMRRVLKGYAASESCEIAGETMLNSIADDGTCYWIRADLDTGTRFLRVYVSFYDADDGSFDLDLETCRQEDVPGRLRLN